MEGKPLRSFRYWWKASHGTFTVLTGFATWIAGVWFGGPAGPLWTNRLFAASGVSALLCFATSFWHYGMAQPVYRRKRSGSIVLTNHPSLFRFIGASSFLAALALAWRLLNATSVGVVLATAIIMLSYWSVLSRHWITKNPVIALAAPGPMLIGWSIAARSPRDDWLPIFLALTALTYLGREMITDIRDCEADRGLRKTLPVRFGTFMPRLAAGLVIFIVAFEMLLPFAFLYGFLVSPSVGGVLYLMSLLILLLTSLRLIKGPRATQQDAAWITAGVGCFLLALLATRLFGAPFYR